MSQTSYPTKMGVALEGQIADLQPHAIAGYAAEVEVGFGIGVIQGTKDTQCKLPGATGFKLLGVVAHSHAREKDAATAADMVNVMRQGAIWVRPEQAVVAGDPAYVRHTANGAGKTPGRFRKDADTDKADLIAGARFRTSAAADGLAILEINLP